MDQLFNLDRYSTLFFCLFDRQHRFLLIAIVLLGVGVVSTLSDKTIERYHGIVYRTEEPKRFWEDVAFYYLGGFIFLYLFLFSN